MNDKPHTSFERHVFLVRCARFNTRATLLGKRLRASMEYRTATSWDLCPEHQKLSNNGSVAVINLIYLGLIQSPRYGLLGVLP